MNHKRIVFLRSNPVSPDSRVEKEVNCLIKEGYDVKIVAWDRYSKRGIEVSNLNFENGKSKIYRVGIPASFGGGVKKNLYPLLKFQLNLAIWLIKNRKSFDIIHACDFDTANTALLCAKILNKKIVYDIFDYYVDAFNIPRYLKNSVEKLDHKIINTADAVIICSEQRKKQIKGTSPNKLTVIHNSPPIIENKKRVDEFSEDIIKICYVGILEERRFLKELTEIIANNSNYEFHVGGFGILEGYFKEKSRECSNIFYYGKLSYSKALELEGNCDIMTAIYDPEVPNHYYAAPNKFYEALMLGKPIIMVNNTGMDDIVSRNNIGEVVEYNEESLKLGLKNLIIRKSEWAEISCKMKKLYEKDYSWNEMERRLINLYKSI